MADDANGISRRDFLKRAGVAGAAVVLAGGLSALAPASAEAGTSTLGPAIGSSWPHPPMVWLTQDKDVSGDCVVVLGLGAGPVFYPDRSNSGFALFHNGNVYLVDAGAGSIGQFMKLGVALDKVKGLFFTHYHIDHTTGFGDLLSRGAQANGPDHNLKTLNVYGPEAPQVGGVNGLDVLTNGIKAGFGPGYDLHFWVKPYVGAPPQAPGPRPTVNTIKIKANPPTAMAAIPILTGDPDVQVEAIEVDHDEDFGTCYAYRFELLNAGVPTARASSSPATARITTRGATSPPPQRTTRRVRRARASRPISPRIPPTRSSRTLSAASRRARPFWCTKRQSMHRLRA